MRGCDFAWGVVPGREAELAKSLKARGFGFVVRYLSRDTSKVITRAEAQAYRAEGLLIVTVYEDTATWMLGGRLAGTAAAHLARQQLGAAGAPARAPVYLADDFQVAAAQLPALNDCVAGADQVLGTGQAGIYGPLAAVDGVHARYKWQTVAWSGGQWDPGDELRQFAISGTTLGVQWDLDVSEAADFGQWQWIDPAPVVSDYVTTGKESLAQIARAHGTRAALILRLTLEHDKAFAPHLAAYIDGDNLSATMPAGITLRVPGHAVAVSATAGKHRARTAASAVRGAVIRTTVAARTAIRAEPALTAGTAAGALSAGVALLHHKLGWHLTPTQLNAIITGLVALAGIAVTARARPVRVGVIATALSTLATAAAAFGLHIPPSVTGGQMPFAALIAGLLVRGHVSPKSRGGKPLG